MPTDLTWHCRGEQLIIRPQPSAKCYIYVAPNQLGTGQSQLLPQHENHPEPPPGRHSNTAVSGR